MLIDLVMERGSQGHKPRRVLWRQRHFLLVPHLILKLGATPKGGLHIALHPALVRRCSRLGCAKNGHIGLELVQLGVKALGQGKGEMKYKMELAYSDICY